MNKDNYLVTGASGLVGFPLVNKLLDTECFVVGIDPVQRENQKNYEHITLINHDVEEIIKVLKKYSITKVIHVGAVSGPMLYNDKPNFIIENNVTFTIRLIEACRLYSKINRFIFCSSISAYGNLGESNTTEDYRFHPENLYGATKASCDLLLKMYYQNYNLDIISLRISTVYGYRRTTSCFINDIVKSALNHSKLNLPFKKSLCWPYVYVEDVVSCIEQCLLHTKGHSYSYNVSGPDFPSYGQILDEISLYVKSPQVTFADQNTFGERKLFSIKKIKEEIGWKPNYSIEDGIRDYFFKIN